MFKFGPLFAFKFCLFLSKNGTSLRTHVLLILNGNYQPLRNHCEVNKIGTKLGTRRAKCP